MTRVYKLRFVKLLFTQKKEKYLKPRWMIVKSHLITPKAMLSRSEYFLTYIFNRLVALQSAAVLLGKRL